MRTIVSDRRPKSFLVALAIVAIASLAQLVFTGDASACASGEYGPSCLQCPGGSATPCNNHGTCDDGVAGSGACTCNVGFVGIACDQCGSNFYNYPTCTFCSAATTCNGNGTCSAGGSCVCNAGITGAACDQCAANYYNYPTCTFCSAATTCNGNGTCSAVGSCVCTVGYVGAGCNQCGPGFTGYPSCVPSSTSTTTTTTTTSTSTSTTTTLPLSAACPALPSDDCLVALVSSITIKDNKLDDTKDGLSWKWSRGNAFFQVDLDDPSSAIYRLCIYDSTISGSALAMSVVVASGANWTDLDPKGWKYVDATAGSDGVTTVLGKPGEEGKTKIQLKAKGSALPLSGPVSLEKYFDMASDVTVQLFNATNGVCWGTEYTSAAKNTAAIFVARTP